MTEAKKKRASSEVQDQARTWATSQEGQRQITESAQTSRKLTVELGKARRIDPKKLDEPITL